MTAAVTRRAAFELPEGSTHVNVTLTWSPMTPFEVSLLFHTRIPRRWSICRDLLDSGLSEPSGDGDVLIQPDPDDPHTIEVVLDNATGYAYFLVPRAVLVDFLAAIRDVVLTGAEVHEDWLPTADDPRWASCG